MQIQRIQTVYLLLAVVLMAVVCFFVPVANTSEEALYIKDLNPLLAITAISGVFVLVDIFLYTNLKLQMRVAVISAILIAVSVVVGAITLSVKLPAEAEVRWILPAAIAVAAFFFVIKAWRGMKADYRLINSESLR